MSLKEVFIKAMGNKIIDLRNLLLLLCIKWETYSLLNRVFLTEYHLKEMYQWFNGIVNPI